MVSISRGISVWGWVETVTYHHCPDGSEHGVAHWILELICASKLGQCNCTVDVISPRCNHIVCTHDCLRDRQ
jgi:hypothetical protein